MAISPISPILARKKCVTVREKEISDGNHDRTEWNTIHGVIGRVLSNFKIFRWFEIMSFFTPEFYDTRAYYQLIVSITKCEKLFDSET